MKRFFFPLLVLSATACTSTSSIVTALNPFRIDVRQGNFVTQEMVSQLQPGQTREQVRFILGTPLITDIFHADRWDYVYRFQPGNGDPIEHRQLTVYFKDNKLLRATGDVVVADPKTLQDKPVVRSVDIESPVAKPVQTPAEEPAALPDIPAPPAPATPL